MGHSARIVFPIYPDAWPMPNTITSPIAPADLARRIDLMADVALQAGDHLAAERLSHQAAHMRGIGA